MQYAANLLHKYISHISNPKLPHLSLRGEICSTRCMFRLIRIHVVASPW